jgi:hypothetical protein
MKENKIPEMHYIILDENGSDVCDYLYTDFKKAEKDAEEVVKDGGYSVFICRVTPFVKVYRGNINKETLDII